MLEAKQRFRMRGVLEFITRMRSDGELSVQLKAERNFLLDPSTYHCRRRAVGAAKEEPRIAQKEVAGYSRRRGA